VAYNFNLLQYVSMFLTCIKFLQYIGFIRFTYSNNNNNNNNYNNNNNNNYNNNNNNNYNNNNNK